VFLDTDALERFHGTQKKAQLLCTQAPGSQLPARFHPQQRWAGTERFHPATIPRPGRTGKTAPLSLGEPAQKNNREEDATLLRVMRR